MKKNLLYLGVMLAATFSLTNCTEDIQSPVGPEKVPYTIYADPAETKTVNDGLTTAWAEGDALSVFHAPAGSKEFSGNSKFTLKDAASGEFTTDNLVGDLAASNDWYAIYPYEKYIATPANTSNGYLAVGSKTSSVQAQEGNSNMKHIAGYNYPMWGITGGATVQELPGLTMTHLTSVVEVKVTNTTAEDLVVEMVELTAEEDICGTYFIDFSTSIPVFTASEDTYVSNTAKLGVSKGEAIAPNGEATFYLGIKPFTAAKGKKLTLSVNGLEKTVTVENDVTFASGKIKTLAFDFDKVVKTEIINATVAEFLAAGVDDMQYYRLTGKISNITNTVYGNFDLSDGTGSVLVYGLTETKVAKNDKSFASLGLKEGDVVTLIGTRTEHEGTAEVGGPAYYVSHVAGTEPEKPVEEADEVIDMAEAFAAQGITTNFNLPADMPLPLSANLTVTLTKHNTSDTNFNAGDPGLRWYKDDVLTVKSTKPIVKIEFVSYGGKNGPVSADRGKMDETGLIWTGEAGTIVFTATAQIRVRTVKVTYGEGEVPEEPEPEPEPEPEMPGTTGSGTAESPYTPADVLAIVNAGANDSAAEVYVSGTIVSVVEVNTTYGNARYYISADGTETDQLQVFRGLYLDGAKFTSTDQIKAGDKVVVLGKLSAYNGTPQVAEGSKIVSLTPGEGGTEPDQPDVPAEEADEVINLADVFAAMGVTENFNLPENTPLPLSANLSVSFTKVNSNNSNYNVSDSGLRWYQGDILSVTSTKVITKVEFVPYGGKNGPVSADIGTMDAAGLVWTGESSAITFTATAQIRVKTVKVTYKD